MSRAEHLASLPLVSVVAPVFNEARTLPELVRRLTLACNANSALYRFEFILVDDGSTDDSLKCARALTSNEPRLRVVELRRNFGQTAALQAGLNSASGDIVVSLDADLQHFPEDIPALLAKLNEGYDLVCGWRHERQEGWLRRWPSRAANAIIRRVTGLPIHDFGTTFRAYRADLVRHLKLLGEQHRFVPALAHFVGARVAEIPIRNVARPSGKSNYGIGRTVSVALDIIYLYFTKRYIDRPLKAFGRVSLFLFGCGGSILSVLLAYAWATGIATVRTRSGWFFLSLVLLLAALQFMLAGLLAEVLVRVYYGIRGNEGYVIRREWRSVDSVDRSGN